MLFFASTTLAIIRGWGRRPRPSMFSDEPTRLVAVITLPDGEVRVMGGEADFNDRLVRLELSVNQLQHEVIRLQRANDGDPA